MKRLLALAVATLALNACEKHKASELPEKYRNHGTHEAKPGTAPHQEAAPAGAKPPTPH